MKFKRLQREVKLTLPTPWRHIGRAEVQLNPFLNSARHWVGQIHAMATWP